MTKTDIETIDGETVEPVLDATETVEPVLDATEKPTKKATKKATKKVTKKPVEKTPKASFPNAEIIPDPLPDPEPNDKERTGEFIRRLLLENVYTSNEIIAAVRENYANSKIKIGDIAFWRHKLRSDGHYLKVVTQSPGGVRYTR